MILLLVFAIGLAAGFVDAIAGGGGLIMLPGLLFSGLPVGGAIATNKLCGTCGAIASTLTFAKSKQIDWRACAAMGIPAVLGAYAGSRSIGRLPTAWAEPAEIVLILMITALVVLKPELGMKQQAAGATVNKPLSLKTRLLGMLLGAAIGFHDGFFGPGTGIFLVFVLLSLWSLDFLKGTGTTKVINLLTNITALATFAASGNIDYTKGIVGAVGVGLGSFIGATFATKKGAKLIKPLFVAVAIALVAKLLFDTATN
ncbi:MAG: sulfite exporter TauE/SafE family protein [Phormidesmis sp.]